MEKLTDTTPKRCGHQRFEGAKVTTNVKSHDNQKLYTLAINMLQSAYRLKTSKGIIRDFILGLECIRSEIL
jgi:hypothetical protein